ncbi:unnamed protein product [Blepharisma stoltei]|uniref:FHA domain-containing protein n=1 Tax=Blepharisma stoltei TaxID=1481888 RepID=A0AAU9K0L8_9CILI|nr:unnamed protein product [Blepharisma stoltei]
MDYIFELSKLEYILEKDCYRSTQLENTATTNDIEKILEALNTTPITIENAMPAIRYFWVCNFYKEFLNEASNLEDFLEKNCPCDANDSPDLEQNQRQLAVESEHFENADFSWAEDEIIKLDQIVEEYIFYESVLQDKKLVLKVQCTPDKCSINVGSEYTFFLSGSWVKTIGYTSSNSEEPDIYVKGPNLLSLKWENNKFAISESKTRSPTGAIFIEEILIKDKDIFLAGNYVFEFSIIDNNSLSLSYRKRDDCSSSKVVWTSDMPVKLIGRSKKVADLSFEEDSTMSKIHAAVEFINGNWYMYNRHSRNGVWKHLHNRRTLDNGKNSEWIELPNYSKFMFHEVIFMVRMNSY